MPIRTKPLHSITAEDLRGLIRRVREDRTLDYKRTLPGNAHRDVVELVKDVSAMANASGGTIVFGIEESQTDAGTVPSALLPIEMDPDQIMRRLDDLNRGNLDERLTGVLQHAVEVEAGRFIHIIRIPASPLAPHMITTDTGKPRFYMRANTLSAPMDMRQVKEAVLQRKTAIDRALAVIEQRVGILRTLRAGRRKTAVRDRIHSSFSIAYRFIRSPAAGIWGLPSSIRVFARSAHWVGTNRTIRHGTPQTSCYRSSGASAAFFC